MADKEPKKANPERGEVEIELAVSAQERRRFVLRPSYEAIAAIERQTGKGLVKLWRSVVTDEFTSSELAVVVYEGLKAAGEPANLKATAEMVYRTRVINVAIALVPFFANALNGGREPDKEETEEAPPTGEAKPATE